MKIDLAEGIEILVFTGPESTGKTTCAERLARENNLPLVEEYARKYLTENGPKYSKDDVLKMAEVQISNEKSANDKHPLIVCDTDQLTYEIWGLEVYGEALGMDNFLVDKKHYFLCYPDIPWEADPLRENPSDRHRLFDRYLKYLQDLKVSFSILKEIDRKTLSF